ncbi:hypothetical protein EV195_10863 [Tenacibaculum skagerrakense]|uniref:Endosialidase-like protein n=1 Tax=Tenacibaculum skagerrakense TaxID=186571 RepID=A0A4R2NQD0_9FLAO|nr:hypothetical protein [Tenacibaculum skagerrakense]TCP23594.1 hypothetical protein EV195_10863 [Tenacibaculum skagerrakense]
MKKILIAIAMVSSVITNAQDENIKIGLSNPANGIKMNMNFPSYNGGWARGFSIANELGDNFISFGAFGSSQNGVASFNYGYIGKAYNETYMVFKPNGYVGIGTTAPNSILDIKSETDKVALRLSMPTNEDAASYEIKWDNTNNNVIHRVQYSNNYYNVIDINRVNRNISFTGGNVGIGTSNPSHNMDISNNSTLRNVGVELDASHYTGTGTSHSYIQFRTPNYKTDNVLTDGAAEIGLSNANGNLYITRKTNVGSNSHGIVLDKNANVGIGTTNIPSGFKLAVTGKMITEEVTVKLQSTWPDYVFTSAYKLPTLQEVEKHIQEKGHLANIPSAEEVSENGIELGEMNKKLLEKVEELTLYTIQQEKAIEKQGKEIDELKALVKKLIDAKK